MKQIDELNLILELLRKYNLPLSPILEYAIKEKMEQVGGLDEDNSTDDGSYNKKKETESKEEKGNVVVWEKESISQRDINVEQPLSIIDYGARSIVVIGDTKPFKVSLKTLGGYFNPRLSCGPGWLFSRKRRNEVEALVNRINSMFCTKGNENYSNNTTCSITPSIYSEYLSTIEKNHGGHYSKSSISVYTAATKSDYMKGKVMKYDKSGNLYNIVNLDVLVNLSDDILQDINNKKTTNSTLIALKLYIQLLNERNILIQ